MNRVVAQINLKLFKVNKVSLLLRRRKIADQTLQVAKNDLDKKKNIKKQRTVQFFD